MNAEDQKEQDEKDATPNTDAAPAKPTADLTPEKDPKGGMLKNKNPELLK